jgi:hypothetical protein
MAKTRKPKVPEKADDKEQSVRFIDAALEHGAEDATEALEQAFMKAVKSRSRRSRGKDPSP